MTNDDRVELENGKILLPESALVTYKFYTKKGERLAIFGTSDNMTENDEAAPEHLKILVFKCSKFDEFSKDVAKQGLLLGVHVKKETKQFGSLKVTSVELEEVHPDKYIIPLEEGNSEKYTFMKFCNENFYKVKREKVEAIKLTFVGQGKSKLIGFEPIKENETK